ncbi:hypothetical protein ACSSS7_003895 [Eimeria intestinalis]
MAIPVDLNDRDSIIQTASTSLQSKVVSQNAALLAPIACDAVLEVLRRDASGTPQVRLQDIRVVKKIGGTVEDCELVKGVVLAQQKVAKRANGPTRIQNAKIGLIQFCLSAPKTDMENNIVITDYSQMDRMLREERVLIAKMVKQIAATGCNCLLIQKSILRDAVNDLSLDYLAKAKILVIRDVERDEIEFLAKTLGCSPVASLDHFTSDKLGRADLVQDEMAEDTSSGLPGYHRRAPSPSSCAHQTNWARTLPGVSQMCAKRFAEALEVVPYTLAENAGLQPLEVVTALRQQHASGNVNSGIDVRQGCVSDVVQRRVLQPLLVTLSAVQLAAEAVAMILKIDDIVMCR